MRRVLENHFRKIEGAMVAFFMLVMGSLTLACAQDVAGDPEAAAAVEAILKALTGKGGTVAMIGALTGGLLQLSKTKWGFGLLARAPSWVRFWIPAVVGAVYGLFADLGKGSRWESALSGAVSVLITAVTTRRMLEVHGVEKIAPVAGKPPTA
jgi:hypothetical protein